MLSKVYGLLVRLARVIPSNNFLTSLPTMLDLILCLYVLSDVEARMVEVLVRLQPQRMLQRLLHACHLLIFYVRIEHTV